MSEMDCAAAARKAATGGWTPSRRSFLFTSLLAGTGALSTGCSLGSDQAGATGPPPIVPVTLSHDWSPKPVTKGGLKCLATQERDQLALHTRGRTVTFWSGVNLGSTLPGHSPGEVAIDRETYRRWFEMMGRFGVRVVRIYTIHLPHMYEELRGYNLAHPNAPLYLVHGIYLPDESYLQTGDLFAEAPTRAMIQEVKDASAAVHGTLERSTRRGSAYGTWTADVSPWTAAWILGVEWDPIATEQSDRKNARAPGYKGKYFSSAPGATPTERWISARMDELAAAEAAHGLSVPIAHANWPTTDPLEHPEEPLDMEDTVSVDPNHVLPSPAWPAGTFASYHAYPYYPDFQLLQPSYQKGGDPYRAYLLDLKRHHRGMPVVISEFGVPSCLGSAHRGSLRRDQGHHSEQEAMQMDADMLRMFKSAGLAGGLVFVWSDEWFKFTWNTVPRQAPVNSERRSLWSDPLTNEKHFGIIAQDPVPVGSRMVHEAREGIEQVTVDHDAAWLYLTIGMRSLPTEPVEIGFDVLPGAGLPLPGRGGEAVNDIAVVIDVPGRKASCFIRDAIDPVLLDGLRSGTIPPPGANGWALQRLTLNRSYPIPGTSRMTPADFLDIGVLVEGTWDTNDPGYSTLATWAAQDADTGELARLRLRLPWSMLAMADPSSKTALLPREVPSRNRGGKVVYNPTGVVIDAINAVVDAGETGRASFPISWEGWNRAQYTERVKAGAQAFVQALSDVIR